MPLGERKRLRLWVGRGQAIVHVWNRLTTSPHHQRGQTVDHRCEVFEPAVRVGVQRQVGITVTGKLHVILDGCASIADPGEVGVTQAVKVIAVRGDSGGD